MPEPLLTVAEVANRLRVTEPEALERIRAGIPGAIRKNDGTFLVPASALAPLLPTGRRGPSRPASLTVERRAELLERARDATRRIENSRAELHAAAADRQDGILALFDGGVSVRGIAAELQVSATVVQTALNEARKRAR